MAGHGGFPFFSRSKVVRLQHRLDPAVEALDHAFGLRMLGWAKTVFDAEPGPELVEGVPADLASFAGLQKRSVNSFR
jgi:hypothetical protein